jgi:sensor histidine kinase YesM
MTVALADLFRYSINYSSNNYSTVKEEVEMAEVYLQIEKIRFEDKLTYEVNADESLNHFLVPRFLVQPLVENAVKHGLKATGRLTHIILEIKSAGDGIIVNVADTGPEFPHDLNPGYGVKSVYDKLDLLFPGDYEILFNNRPRKQVSVKIQKRIKNEPVV